MALQYAISASMCTATSRHAFWKMTKQKWASKMECGGFKEGANREGNMGIETCCYRSYLYREMTAEKTLMKQRFRRIWWWWRRVMWYYLASSRRWWMGLLLAISGHVPWVRKWSRRHWRMRLVSERRRTFPSLIVVLIDQRLSIRLHRCCESCNAFGYLLGVVFLKNFTGQVKNLTRLIDS